MSGLVLMPVPEGVASPDGSQLYVPGLRGGIDAIDTLSGALRWHFADARIALLGLEHAVLVLAGGSEVQPLRLSADTGEPVGPALPALPKLPGEWWLAGTQWDGRFLWIGWRSVQRSGSTARTEEGTLRLDLEHLDMPAVQSPPPAPPAWPCGTEAQPFRDGSAEPLPWRAGGFDVVPAVTAPQGDTPDRALLLCRRAGPQQSDRHDPVTLLEHLPRRGYVELHASPDPGLVTLLHTNDRPTADGRPAGSVSEWLFFSAPEGERLLALPAEPGLLPPFTHVGSVLLGRQLGPMPSKRLPPARELRAWDLRSGEPLWRHALPAAAPERLVS
jgi:hypothetical protein